MSTVTLSIPERTLCKSVGGRVELIIGPMFSGKTSLLINKVGRYTFGKNRKNTIILKWNKDTRDETKSEVRTHNGSRCQCMRVNNQLMNGKTVMNLNLLLHYDVIGIDEGHFFGLKDDLILFCETMTNMYNKIVIVAALDSDYKREPFIEVCKLVSKCEAVTKLQAICGECSGDASFSLKQGGKTNLKSKRIEVGGDEKYSPVCRGCYLRLNK